MKDILAHFAHSRVSTFWGEGQLGKDLVAVDLDKQLDQQRKIADAMAAGREAGESHGDKPQTAQKGALLQPEMKDDVRVRYSLAPVAMLKLEPLWTSKTWTKEECLVATSAATYLGTLPDAPKCKFAEAKVSENHAQLERLVRWFNLQVAKPDLYAAMIITVDDGPFAGLPYDTQEVLPAKSMIVLDEPSGTELHLCQDTALAEPWVLQLVRDKKLVWSRILSGSPRGRMGEAELIKESRHWDGYGYKAFMRIKWTYGSERCYLYLGEKAEMLFYFLTW